MADRARNTGWEAVAQAVSVGLERCEGNKNSGIVWGLPGATEVWKEKMIGSGNR